MRKLLLLGFIGIALSFVGCEKQTEKDREDILEYINDNNINAQETEEGIFYVISEDGTGNHPSETAEVTVNYKGYLLDGTVFDANDNIKFRLNQVISGWTKGIPLFKKGGSGTLIIPSHLGYGSRKVGTIPANSVLVFEVDLISFIE